MTVPPSHQIPYDNLIILSLGSTKVVKVKAAQSCPTLCDPMDQTGHGFPRPEYWRGQPFPSPGHLPNPGIEPRSPASQADSLPAEPQGNPKNTGVGSLSLVQRIFPTQESNQGLLHCRRILYQLSSQGSPNQGMSIYYLCTYPSMYLSIIYLYLSPVYLSPMYLICVERGQ